MLETQADATWIARMLQTPPIWRSEVAKTNTEYHLQITADPQVWRR